MTRHSRHERKAFTLIEMIRVLAVITIVGALLIPKIFEAINNARITNTLLSCHTMKMAVLEHYGGFLSLASSNGVPLIVATNANGYPNFDAVLLAEGLIDEAVESKIAGTSLIRLRDVSGATKNTTVDPGKNESCYDLDGDGFNDIVGAQYLVEALLIDVSDADARALNDFLGRITIRRVQQWAGFQGASQLPQGRREQSSGIAYLPHTPLKACHYPHLRLGVMAD